MPSIQISVIRDKINLPQVASGFAQRIAKPRVLAFQPTRLEPAGG